MSSPSDLYNYKADILYVVDGDTADLRIDMGFKTYRDERVRFMGMNAPERGVEPGYSNAKCYVQDLQFRLAAGTSQLYIQTFLDKHDVYGRYLAYLCEWVMYPDRNECKAQIDITQDMIAKGLAVEYMPH